MKQHGNVASEPQKGKGKFKNMSPQKGGEEKQKEGEKDGEGIELLLSLFGNQKMHPKASARE